MTTDLQQWQSASNSKRVLVVDDDLPMRTMLSQALRMKGYQVILAEDGLKAQRIISKFTPGIMLLDLMMPGMNGWQLMDWMESEKLLGDIRVIIISAHLKVEPDRLVAQGAAGILPKPFNLGDLFDMLSRVSPPAD